MFNKVKQVLTSRRVVQILFMTTSAVLLLLAIAEQVNRDATAEGRGLSRLLGYLDIAGISASWLFALLLMLFFLSLTISTIQQIKAALRHMRAVPDAMPEAACSVPGSTISSLSRLRYLQVLKQGGLEKHVAAPWGYFGRPVLHLGLGLAIASSALYFFTEHRVIVRVIGGMETHLADSIRAVSRGKISAPVELPQKMRLLDLRTEYWENDQLKGLQSSVEMVDAKGVSHHADIGLSRKGRYKGMILYQQGDFGRAFFVEGVDEKGEPLREVLTIPMPSRRDKAGYENFPLSSGAELKAKFYADREKKTLDSDHPELVLRLVVDGRVAGETALSAGETGRLGPYTLSLKDVRWWTELLFEGSRGAAAIFFGFFLMVSGALVTYFSSPREAYVWRIGEQTFIYWRATRFAEFYESERVMILQNISGDAE